MPQTTTLIGKGLFTYPDLLSEVPSGALTIADNTVIDRDGVIGPRRGLALYGNSFGTIDDTAKQLLYYKGRLLRHWGADLDFDSDNNGTFVNIPTFTDVFNSDAITEQSPGVKIKYQEMNGNFYFTTNRGIQKISSTTAANVTSTSIEDAGGIEALDVDAFLNSNEGWFIQNSQVAYRIVWGITDVNQNLIVGTPSERAVLDNSQLLLMINDFNRLVNSLDIAASVPPIVLTGNSHSNNVIDNLSDTSNLSIGMTVADTTTPSNILAGTTILNITGPNSITLSQNAVGTTTGDTYSFGQLLHDTTYSLLELPTTASSVQLYEALQALSAQLDADIGHQTYNGLTGTITNIAPSISINSTGNINFSNTISNIPSVSNIFPGMTVTGDGIDTGTTVLSASAPGPLTGITGTIDGTTATITSMNTVVGIAVGMTISGDGIPAGSYVIDIVSSSSITISNITTIPATGVNFTFTNNTVTLSTTTTANIANDTINFFYPTVIQSGNHGLVTGQLITISGTNSSPSIDTSTPVQVTVIDSNDFSILTQTNSGGNSGTWFSYPLAVSQNFLVPPENPATTTELTAVQQFYDAIVNELNVDDSISNFARSAIGGDFLNSTQSATANVIFTIPSKVTTADFYQVYRSDMSTSIGQSLLSDQAADDEMKLIVEANPTPQDITNQYINFYDNVPESFRVNGANLYTNAISGAGILQENNVPPYAQDITLWQNFMFFANTSEKHQIEIDLLTGDVIGGVFTTTYGKAGLTPFNVVANYTFVADVSQFTTVVVPAGSAFPTTGTADSFDIFSAENYITYRFYFNVGTVTPPSATGVTLIPVNILATDTADQVAAKLQLAMFSANQDFGVLVTGDTITIENLNPGYTNSPVNNVTASGFSIVVSVSGSGESATLPGGPFVGVPNSPTPAQQIDAVARSLVRMINRNPSGGLQAQYLSGPTDLPGQISIETIETSQVPFYLTATSDIGMDFNPSLPTTGSVTSNTSTNQTYPNRLYFSKVQEPDAVPAVNFVNVGQEDYPILRVMPLRDSLFVLKEDGVFRLYGTDPTNFTVYLFDSSAKLIAQDSAVVLNNQVYMFSNQGIVTVSDTGISVISRPIENNIVPINNYPNFATTCFGVTYEMDRSYLFAAQAASTDTVPTVIYRYNTLTTTWTNWPISKTCGVVIPDTNILYMGPSDTDFIEKERKSFTRLDFADREYVQTLPSGGVNGMVLNFGSVFEAEVGDALVQTQYLTVPQFNGLISKLDRDPGLQNSYASLIANPGDNLRGDVTTLAAALDADPGTNTKTYSSSIVGFTTSFPDTQAAFNTIIALLNADTGLRLHSYLPSNDTVGWEVLVTAINVPKGLITVQWSLPFIAGPVSIYKSIDSIVQWAPQHFGDPSLLKRVPEGTIMFANKAFDNAMLSYSTDLYTGEQGVPFTGEGGDTWGGVAWGSTTWGGDGTAIPFRTYVPVVAQKCRYIQPQFEHNNALRQYAIFGVSYTWEGISSRAYR